MKTITFDETKWKLVPIDPTREMIEAALHASIQHVLDCIADPARSSEIGSEENCKKTHASRYKSMISAAPEYEPGADEDGWIKWEGGDCPIGLDQMVDVMFRYKQEFHSEPACELSWEHKFGGGDIVAYRISK